MASADLYPLRFKPIFKPCVWGGRRLKEALGKDLPGQEDPYGESWELVDLPDPDQSIVDDGPLAGATLHDLVVSDRDALMGPAALDGGRFPLLVKYIDAAQTLSVQVHPAATAAAELGGRPKSEAWYIMEGTAEARIYLGLKPGTTSKIFREALERGGEVEQLLGELPALAHELVPVRPGTVHAIGAGTLLAEVQQPSDTTYRVYDWGRLGLDGAPRQLHVGQALRSIHWAEQAGLGPDPAEQVDMDLFQIRRVGPATTEMKVDLTGAGPAVVVGLQGSARLEGQAAAAISCRSGEVVLVPHCCRRGNLRAAAGARLLLVTFPSPGAAA